MSLKLLEAFILTQVGLIPQSALLGSTIHTRHHGNISEWPTEPTTSEEYLNYHSEHAPRLQLIINVFIFN